MGGQADTCYIITKLTFLSQSSSNSRVCNMSHCHLYLAAVALLVAAATAEYPEANDCDVYAKGARIFTQNTAWNHLAIRGPGLPSHGEHVNGMPLPAGVAITNRGGSTVVVQTGAYTIKACVIGEWGDEQKCWPYAATVTDTQAKTCFKIAGSPHMEW